MVELFDGVGGFIYESVVSCLLEVYIGFIFF